MTKHVNYTTAEAKIVQTYNLIREERIPIGNVLANFRDLVLRRRFAI